MNRNSTTFQLIQKLTSQNIRTRQKKLNPTDKTVEKILAYAASANRQKERDKKEVFVECFFN